MADIQQMAPVISDADREVARTLRREKVSRVVRYVVLILVSFLLSSSNSQCLLVFFGGY